MKRKISVWLAAAMLCLYCLMPVHAAPEDSKVEAVSGYCMGDELYIFVRMGSDFDLKSTRATLRSDAVSSADEAAASCLTDTGANVHYIFMVDLSGSMKDKEYNVDVNAFVQALVEREKQNAFYTVATFGEQFEVVQEKLTDRNAVINSLNDLQYTENLTDPYTGVESALTYLESYPRRSGDVVNLIIITDGAPDLGHGDTEKEGTLAQSAADRITRNPEIIVSTFCTGAAWNDVAYDALSQGKGSHQQIGADLDAKAAGEKMADYVDGLKQIKFRLNNNLGRERFSIEVEIQGRNTEGINIFNSDHLENLPNIKPISNNPQDIGLVPGESIPGEEEGTEEPVPGDASEPGENAPGSLAPIESETEPIEDHGQTVDEDEDEETGSGWLLWVILAGAVVLVIGVCVVVIVVVKGRSRTVPAGTLSNGLRMRLEVYSGNCVNMRAAFYLKDSFLIGRGKKCDLIFSNPEVAMQNSRIFVRDGSVYIEDLNSAEGTAIGGMRIQGQNRLRSGDVVSIGAVEFSLMF